MDREREKINSLFTYGTLMIEEIFQKFSNLPTQKSKGYLIGYECRQLKNRKYPGLIIGNGLVNGLLYHHLSDQAFKNIDHYEGQEYNRDIVLVNIDEKQKIMAWCYFYKEEFRSNILNDEWTLDWYFKNK